jgi:hypothetical protein
LRGFRDFFEARKRPWGKVRSQAGLTSLAVGGGPFLARSRRGAPGGSDAVARTVGRGPEAEQAALYLSHRSPAPFAGERGRG